MKNKRIINRLFKITSEHFKNSYCECSYDNKSYSVFCSRYYMLFSTEDYSDSGYNVIKNKAFISKILLSFEQVEIDNYIEYDINNIKGETVRVDDIYSLNVEYLKDVLKWCEADTVYRTKSNKDFFICFNENKTQMALLLPIKKERK